MTRPFNQQVHCPNCQTWITHETSFGRWIRNNSQLDSALGYCVSDQDYWIQKFKTYEGRDFQLLMLVEIKTMGSKLTKAQIDLLHMANQVMRNRRWTPTKDLKFQPSNGVSKVYSYMSNKEVYLRTYGVHVLTFSGLGPDDSEWITWDTTKPIDKEILTSILSFDLDPDTLNKIDLRSHHKMPTWRAIELGIKKPEVAASGPLLELLVNPTQGINQPSHATA